MGVTVNKNAIPFDPEKPSVTSGIRIGTPSVTTRGFDANAMQEVGDIIDWVLNKTKDQEQVKEYVHDLCDRYPIYSN